MVYTFGPDCMICLSLPIINRPFVGLDIFVFCYLLAIGEGNVVERILSCNLRVRTDSHNFSATQQKR